MPSLRTMLYQTSRQGLALVLTVGLSSWALPARSADAESTQTMKDLNTALNGERNAHERYLEFAKKADEEGYGAVAGLFRGARAAEVCPRQKQRRGPGGGGGPVLTKRWNPPP